MRIANAGIPRARSATRRPPALQVGPPRDIRSSDAFGLPPSGRGRSMAFKRVQYECGIRARIIAATVESNAIPVITASSAALVNSDPKCREHHEVRLDSPSPPEPPRPMDRGSRDELLILSCGGRPSSRGADRTGRPDAAGPIPRFQDLVSCSHDANAARRRESTTPLKRRRLGGTRIEKPRDARLAESRSWIRFIGCGGGIGGAFDCHAGHLSALENRTDGEE